MIKKLAEIFLYTSKSYFLWQLPYKNSIQNLTIFFEGGVCHKPQDRFFLSLLFWSREGEGVFAISISAHG